MNITYLRASGPARRPGEDRVPHAALAQVALRGHEVDVRTADGMNIALETALAHRDAVMVEESCDPAVVDAVVGARGQGSSCRLLFHDAGVRSALAPEDLQRLPLDDFDAILVGSEAAASRYRAFGVARPVTVWRESIDIWRFPPRGPSGRSGVVSFTDWGDGPRGEEILRMLLRPARDAQVELSLFGRGYPADVAEKLAAAGVRLAEPPVGSARAETWGRASIAVEVPPREICEQLPGMLTATMLEALATGTPLIVANWQDADGLFTPGEHLLVAKDAAEMAAQLRRLESDEALRTILTVQSRLTVLAHHSASHRADELIALIERLKTRSDAAPQKNEKVDETAGTS